MKNARIGIIGSGAWGTALATNLAATGRTVLLWSRQTEIAESINVQKQNPRFLPKITLDRSLKATNNLNDFGNSDALLLAVPTQHLREIVKLLAPRIQKNIPIVICSKGIEETTSSLASAIVQEILPETTPAVLSGPTFAAEVAKGLPTAATLACQNKIVCKELAEKLHCKNLRLYLSDDLVGVQVGGALKNVIAIAAGIVDGLNLGESARAAVITRGLIEIMRVGLVLGAQKHTLMGLSGLGDLVLTCSSPRSRNFSLGAKIATGASASDFLSKQHSVAEGAYTAAAAISIANKNNLELPITKAVYSALEGHLSAKDLISNFVNRPLRYEDDWKW